MKNFINPKGHQNCISSLKVTTILLKWCILPVGGVASGRVCAAGLFLKVLCLPFTRPKKSIIKKILTHIVPYGKFHRIGGASPETLPNVKYDAPEEVGGDRKCFDSPIRK